MTNIANDLIATFASMQDAVAIVDVDGTAHSYAQLLSAIEQGRHRVAAAALPPGSKVILQVPKGMAFASAAIALAAEGHVSIGIEMAQGDAVYRDRAAYVDARAVITSGQVRAIQRTPLVRGYVARLGIDVPPSLKLPAIKWDLPRTDGATYPLPAESRADEEIAFVVFTGGTSAHPKGVQLSHQAVRSYIAGLNHLPEWSDIRSIVADHPQQVLYGLAHGKTVYLSPARKAIRARRTAELLFEEGIDAYFGSPATWSQVLDEGVHQPATTWPTAVLLGGAPVMQPMLERLERELDSSVSIRCLYGMSEAGLVAHISASDKLTLLRSGECVGDPVGEVVAGVTAAIADDGELLIGSPSRFSGYVGEELAARDELFPSGDIGSMVGEQLHLLGRKKHMIVQDGVNLYPEQFESQLLAQRLANTAAFDEVALIPGPADVNGDEHFVLVYASPSTTTSAALQIGRRVLPRGHEPSHAVRLHKLPRTGRQNKIDRRALAAQCCNPSLASLHARIFDGLIEKLPARSSERRRAVAMRSITRRNLRRTQELAASSTPAHQDVEIEPVFILGHQRSGTTFLHHALASSPSACAMTLPEMLAPHRTGWKTTKLLTPITKTAIAAMKKAPRWQAMLKRHDLDPIAPEEEEWMLAALGLSGFVPSGFSSTVGDEAFDYIRDRANWPAATRHALVDLYASIIRAWHAGRGTPTLRHIAKNPAFGPIAGELSNVFPHARFVVALRDPHQAICSRLALIESIHDRSLTEIETATIVQDSLRQMRGLAEQLALFPPENVHYVMFGDLMSEPRQTVDACCAWAGIDPPSALPERRRSTPRPAPVGVPSQPELFAAAPGFRDLFVEWKAAS